MDIKGWSYYNHGAIPSIPPHEEPNLLPIKDKSIWKIDGGTPFLARWTTDFDCGYETNWWYVIKDTPYKLEDVSKKEQKSIRQALRKCYVKKITHSDYVDELYQCYSSSFLRYENADNMKSKDDFIKDCKNQVKNSQFWGGFDAETNMLIGYMTVYVYDSHTEIRTFNFIPEYSNKQVSDALYYTVLNYYLNECAKKYVSSGSRNINHKTNTQEYKIRRFGYRKAYCNLHIEYNPKIKWIIFMLYPFRKIVKKFDKITFIHQINAVLFMEEIVRNKTDNS